MRAAKKSLKRKPPPGSHAYTFLTNHSHVLFCLAAAPQATLREIAFKVGITERATISIVRDLAETQVLAITKIGRRNVYAINRQIHLRHPVEAHRTVGDLLDI